MRLVKDGCQRNGEAEGLKLSDRAVFRPARTKFAVVVGAEILVESARSEHVPDDDEHRVLDRDVGLHRSSPTGRASVACAEVGLGLCDGDGGGSERTLQVWVAGPGPGGLDLARGLIVAGGGAGPRGQMVRCWEAGHVRTCLGPRRRRRSTC